MLRLKNFILRSKQSMKVLSQLKRKAKEKILSRVKIDDEPVIEEVKVEETK